MSKIAILNLNVFQKYESVWSNLIIAMFVYKHLRQPV